MNGQQEGLELWPDATTVGGGGLARIRRESRDEAEKGKWFENLTVRLLRSNREFEVDDVWRWTEWPERSALTGGRSGQARRTQRVIGASFRRRHSSA